MRQLLLGTAAMFGCLMGLQTAQAEVFTIGSTFTDSGTNSPGSFTQSVVLQNGTTVLDGGALDLTVSIVPTGNSAGDEWLVFHYQTVGGGPLVPPGDDWSIDQTGLVAAVPGNFVGAFDEFLTSSGTDLPPTTSVFGQNILANPVPGGVGIGQGVLGVTDLFPAGPLGALGAFIDPFDQLDGTGIPSADVSGFYQALEFAPQTPPPPTGVPEPASLTILGSAMVGLGVIRRRRKSV
jgi:hypothetical protein